MRAPPSREDRHPPVHESPKPCYNASQHIKCGPPRGPGNRPGPPASGAELHRPGPDGLRKPDLFRSQGGGRHALRHVDVCGFCGGADRHQAALRRLRRVPGLGQTIGGDWHPIESNDDGNGRTDARLVVTPGRSGTYSIRVKTLRAGESGRYALSVEPVSPESLSPTMGVGRAFAGSISPGWTARGRLRPSDTRESFDARTYDGRAGRCC